MGRQVKQSKAGIIKNSNPNSKVQKSYQKRKVPLLQKKDIISQKNLNSEQEKIIIKINPNNQNNNLNSETQITVHKMNTNPKTKNLNEYKKCPEYIVCEGKVVSNHVKDFAESQNVKLVSIFHNNLHDHFLNIMEKYGKNRTIVGCIAWLTSDQLINSLSNAKQVALVVNDENYSKWGFGCVTREKYKKLPPFKRPFLETWGNKIVTPLNVLSKVYEPVRCFGTQETQFLNSIMHIKTVIICDDDDMPRWIWQGSMNFTNNSQNNLENAVFIDDKNLALHSFLNFSNVFIFSKPVRY
jgi:hypothetical protein